MPMSEEEKKERAKEYYRQYYLKNKEAYAARSRKWQSGMTQEQREKKYEANAEWRRRNGEKMRAYRVKYEGKNPDRNATWREKNREVYLACTNECRQRRRAKMQEAPPDVVAFITEAARMTSFACAYCYGPHRGRPTIDHAIPLSRGGQHVISNLTHCCPSCNSQKKDKTPEEFARYREAKAAALAIAAKGSTRLTSVIARSRENLPVLQGACANRGREVPLLPLGA